MNTETQEKWNEKQIKYIEFLGRGKKDLKGKQYSREEFAKAIGVNPWTLYQWQKLPGFKQAVFESALGNKVEYIEPLINAQVASGLKKGRGGDTQAFLAIMRQFELLKADKVDSNVEVTGDVKFTNQVPVQ